MFPIEEMERGETDVGHFLFAKNEALIWRGIVKLRDAGGGHRGCGCTTHQRKTQSGGTQHFHSGGFGCALLLRSLLDPWHGRILRKFLRKRLGSVRSAKPARKGFLWHKTRNISSSSIHLHERDRHITALVKRNPAIWVRGLAPVGRSVASGDLPDDGQITGLPVQPRLQKYFCFHLTQITGLFRAVSRSPGGALRDRHGRGVRDAVDADVLTTNSADADGEVVWS